MLAPSINIKENYVKIFSRNLLLQFKILHELDELNEKVLSNIDNRKDGKVEIIDVTVNNRKTKKAGMENSKKIDLQTKLELIIKQI